MKPRIKIIFAALALIVSSLACVTIMGEDLPEGAPLEQPIIQPPTPQEEAAPLEVSSCPVITEQIIEVNTPVYTDDPSAAMDYGGRDEEYTATYLVTYLVSGDVIYEPYYEDVEADLRDEQDDAAAHQRIWDYFVTLIPAQNRTNLAEYSIMTDGQDNVLAAVAQTYDDPALWGLEVDIVDSSDYYYLTFTLIHEYAHLLTLGPDQVPPSLAVFNNPDDNDLYLKEVSACPNYFPGEGCANADSYINAFYDQFWSGIYDEWNEINLEEDDDAYYELLDEFYYKYEDQFVTDYAATHPAEDIAESFSFFVFSDKPAGDTIAEQKILFFYQYPELVQLRAEILTNLCANFPQ